MSATSSKLKHTAKQLKFVVPGGLSVYFTRPLTHLWLVLDQQTWAPRVAAKASIATGLVTVSLFAYLLVLPWFRGYQPNYRQWRDSGELALVIPVLTASIILGYFFLIATLSYWTELGPLKSVIAGTGLYVLTFGLMGLFPVPNRGKAA